MREVIINSYEWGNSSLNGLGAAIPADLDTSMSDVKTPEEQSAMDQVFNWFSETASAVGQSVQNYVNEATVLINEGYEKAYAKLEEAKTNMNKAIKEKDYIESQIEKIPEGPDKERVKQKYNESKSFFTDYVLPAWAKFASMTGLDDDPHSSSEDMKLGYAQIVIGAAVVVAAIALIYATNRYFDFLTSVKDDPAFSASEKSGLLTLFSAGGVTHGFAEATKNLKWPLIIGGLAILGLTVVYYTGRRKA